MIGIAPARVPLPIELAEDGPIYVNAKQYNGILRRRQIRAKLEAQNKLLKNRKVCDKDTLEGSFHHGLRNCNRDGKKGYSKVGRNSV